MYVMDITDNLFLTFFDRNLLYSMYVHVPTVNSAYSNPLGLT